jgi:hypothetical protein
MFQESSSTFTAVKSSYGFLTEINMDTKTGVLVERPKMETLSFSENG